MLRAFVYSRFAFSMRIENSCSFEIAKTIQKWYSGIEKRNDYGVTLFFSISVAFYRRR